MVEQTGSIKISGGSRLYVPPSVVSKSFRCIGTFFISFMEKSQWRKTLVNRYSNLIGMEKIGILVQY